MTEEKHVNTNPNKIHPHIWEIHTTFDVAPHLEFTKTLMGVDEAYIESRYKLRIYPGRLFDAEKVAVDAAAAILSEELTPERPPEPPTNTKLRNFLEAIKGFFKYLISKVKRR